MITKTILNVPYKDKDEAKQLGAKWDPQQKTWYVPPGTSSKAFKSWLPKESKQPSLVVNEIGLIRNIISCWSCKGFCTVHSIYARKITDQENLYKGFFILSDVNKISDDLSEFLISRCQNYRIGKPNADGIRSYRNHCDHCSIGLSEQRLNKKGAAFNPDKLTELKTLQCIELSFFTDIEVTADYIDYTKQGILSQIPVTDYVIDFV